MKNKILFVRSLLALISTTFVCVLILPAATAFASAATQGTPLVSTWEQSTGGSEDRDCGYSAPVAGKDLWIFCDTALYSSANSLVGFITGSTAAEGSYSSGSIPSVVKDLPSGTDQQFIATPTGLTTSSGAACNSANGAYAASWTTGATTVPGTDSVLLTFNNYCVTSAAMTFEGFGTAVYTAGANLPIAGHTIDASVPPAATLGSMFTLGSPIISGGYVYLYSSDCTTSVYGVCTAGNVWLARVTTANYQNAKDYTWLGANGVWESNPANAVNIIPGATPLSINVAVTSKGVTLVSENNIAGGYTIWTSQNLGSGFTSTITGTVPCSDTTTGAGGLCRALIAHPEFSNTSELTLSYFNPGVAPDGHVVTTQVLW